MLFQPVCVCLTVKVTLNMCAHPEQAPEDEVIRGSGCCGNTAYSLIQLTHMQERTLTLTGIFRSANLRAITVVIVKVKNKHKKKKKQKVEEF